MNRRKFRAYGAIGAAGAAAPWVAPTDAHAASIRYELTIEPVDVEMIDGVSVYMLLYYGGAPGEVTPRPLLRAREGDLVTIRIRNNAPEAHRFSIPGIGAASMSQIAPGTSREVTFTAPTAGTYVYVDPLNAPVNRLLGLHGAFIVSPANGLTAAGKPTPYSASTHTPSMRTIFDAFGTNPRFPGDTWRPDLPDREKVWIFSQTDPALNRKAELRQTINAANTIATFVPRYFTINGLSGFDLEEVEIVCAKGYIGEPTLIRTMNCGQCTHSPHIHGNHVFEVATSRPNGTIAISNNIFERDVWTLAPLERRDVILPFERPPDAPAAAWPPTEEPFPMRFVMHCHTEMSQTAGGGNYPQGLVTHWELLGLQRP
jgi:FtsP/CotA-like multicopper oxidase with cupredoxin domain